MKIKKNILSLCMILVTIIAIPGCEELTESVLTNKQITILAPVDNLVTTNTTNTFAWERLEGATKYQLQIVSPKFDSVVSFIVDSTFTNNNLTYTLSPGMYEWRVRATNSSSQTNYLKRSITIQ